MKMLMKRFIAGKITRGILILLIPISAIYFVREKKITPIPKETEVTETYGSEAAAYDFEMTKDPALGYPPVERMYRALEEIQSLKAGLKTAAVPNFNWTEMGPDNAGGRTRAVMFDPNDPEGKKVWAGGVTGGMWFNNDITQPESRWTKVQGFIDNLTVSCIAYDPDNTDVFYAGTGEKWYFALSNVKESGVETIGAVGKEIYKSVDGGTTWTNVDIPNVDIQFVHKILVAGGKTYVGSEKGLYVWNSADDTWSQVLTEEVTDLELDSNGLIYAAAIASGGGAILYKNNNGTFTDISPSLLTTEGATAKRVDIAVAPSDPNVIYILGATWPQPNSNFVTFISTTDGGANWADVTIPQMFDGWGNFGGPACGFIPGVDFGWGAAAGHMILKVNPDDPMNVYVAAIDLYRSSDGGQTWGENGDGAPISHWNRCYCNLPDRTADPSLFFNPSDMHGDMHEILFRPGHPEQMVFGTDGGIWYTHDVTPQVPVFDPRNLGLNITQFYTVGVSNLAGSRYAIGGTQDNGAQQLSPPNFVFPASGSDEGGLQAGPLYQGDGAYTFIDQDNPNFQFYSFQNSNLRYSIDGGKNFYYLQNSGLGEFVNPMEYDSQNNIWYVTGLANFGGIGVRSFYQRIKGFENISPAAPDNYSSVNLTDFVTLKTGANRVSAIRLSPYTANRAFVGTAPGYTPSNSGIYVVDNMDTRVSEDLANMISLNTILPHNWISCIEVGASDNNLLVTYSNYGVVSVYETQDGGASWQDKEGNLPDIPVRWALYNPSNRNQAMVATELGVWYTDDITVVSPVWEQVPDLESVRVDMLRYRPSDGMVFAATHGRGIWSSDIWATTSIADFTVSNKVGYINQPIQFFDRSIGTQAVYSWDFGDSQTSTDKNPVHMYQSAGTYTVSLTINSGADQAVMSNLISILPDKTGSYAPADGGDFESNTGDFAAETTHGFNGINSATKFELGNSSITGKDGVVSGANAWVLNLSISGYDSLLAAYLYTPNFDFSSGGSYTLSFSAKYDFAEGFDGFIVEYSTDRGEHWYPVQDPNSSSWYDKAVKPASFSTFNKGELFFSGTSSGYEVKTADVSYLGGNPTVAFRFTVRSNDQDSGAGSAGLIGANHNPPYAGLAIDDVYIEISSVFADFVAANLTGCTGSVITFSDQSTAASGATLDTFDWNFGDGATPATATGQGPHDVVYSTTGFKTVTLTVNGTAVKTKTDYIEIVDQILNQVNITSNTPESCPGSYANIILEGAESGATYQIVNAATNDVLGTVSGAGSISVDIGPLDQSITIKVIGTVAGSSCILEMNDQVSITITNAPIPVITQSGEMLSSTTGDSYQWFLNGQPIAGATSQTYTPIFIGDYQVQLTVGGCTRISGFFSVLVVGLQEKDFSLFNVYPNPASSWITLHMQESCEEISVSIINTSGEIVKRMENVDLRNSTDYSIDISRLPSGLYFISVQNGEEKVMKKIIKY